MRKIFTLLTAAVAVCWCVQSAHAQKIENVKQRLAHSETGLNGHSASVTVTESGSAAGAVRRGESATSAASAAGFRIVIFFDNGSSARPEAERIMAGFKEAYPDVHCDIRYENPYFKVLAGNCVTSEDAVILLGRIRSSFPEAYIMREDIPLNNFITPKPVEFNVLTDAESANAEI